MLKPLTWKAEGTDARNRSCGSHLLRLKQRCSSHTNSAPTLFKLLGDATRKFLAKTSPKLTHLEKRPQINWRIDHHSWEKGTAGFFNTFSLSLLDGQWLEVTRKGLEPPQAPPSSEAPSSGQFDFLCARIRVVSGVRNRKPLHILFTSAVTNDFLSLSTQ